MLYTLTAPCGDCPFRTDLPGGPFPLRRADEIASGLEGDVPFTCHKTTTNRGRTARHRESQHCAGALIVLEKMKRPHLAMKLGQRLGLYNPAKLKMDSPVYDNLQAFVYACGNAEGV